MADPLFRLICTPSVLDGAPDAWVTTMLQEGEFALLVDDGGIDAVMALAHKLGLVTIPLLRAEGRRDLQDSTVMAYAASKPLVWVAESFDEAATTWAHKRGPMTLLLETAGPLSDDERHRVDRFVVILGRQAE